MNRKHILIKQPRKSGSYHFSYKGSFSIVLLALVDVNYRFTYANIRCSRRVSDDGGVFRASKISAALNNYLLGIPPQSTLMGYDKKLPYVIAAVDVLFFFKKTT